MEFFFLPPKSLLDPSFLPVDAAGEEMARQRGGGRISAVEDAGEMGLGFFGGDGCIEPASVGEMERGRLLNQRFFGTEFKDALSFFPIAAKEVVPSDECVDGNSIGGRPREFCGEKREFFRFFFIACDQGFAKEMA